VPGRYAQTTPAGTASRQRQRRHDEDEPEFSHHLSRLWFKKNAHHLRPNRYAPEISLVDHEERRTIQVVRPSKRTMRAATLATLIVSLMVISGCSNSGAASAVHGSSTTALPSGPQFTARLLSTQSATTSALDGAATIVTSRLRYLGVSHVQATIDGGSIVLTLVSQKSASTLRSELEMASIQGILLFRPVLCAGPAYNLKAVGKPVAPPVCPAANRLTASALNVDTSSGGPTGTVSPWAGMSAYPSDSDRDDPSGTVILPTSAESAWNGERLLLGPAQVADNDISSAQAVLNTPDWDLDLDLNGPGSTAWDKLAQQQFHAYVGIDLDGLVISAPINQPTQAVFSSFDGKVQISGDFTEASANGLAAALQSGPLALTLTVASFSRSEST
jgi:hypothetical protein